jgi:hypothetical protein
MPETSSNKAHESTTNNKTFGIEEWVNQANEDDLRSLIEKLENMKINNSEFREKLSKVTEKEHKSDNSSLFHNAERIIYTVQEDSWRKIRYNDRRWNKAKWLNEVIIDKKIEGISDQDAVRKAVKSFDSRLKQWFATYVAENGLPDWKTLVLKFKEMHYPLNYQLYLREKLFKITQYNNERVIHFKLRLDDLYDAVDNKSTIDKVECFMSGVRPDVLHELIKANKKGINDYEELCKIARDEEDIIRTQVYIEYNNKLKKEFIEFKRKRSHRGRGSWRRGNRKNNGTNSRKAAPGSTSKAN